MKKQLMALSAGLLIACTAQAQTTVVSVQEAALDYACDCSKDAFNAMSESARSFLEICSLLSDEQIGEEIEAKKGMEKWDAMQAEYEAYNLATAESCSEQGMMDALKKRFPKNKDAAMIETALSTPPDDATVLSWSIGRSDCSHIIGYPKLLLYQMQNTDLDLDIDLDLDGND